MEVRPGKKVPATLLQQKEVKELGKDSKYLWTRPASFGISY